MLKKILIIDDDTQDRKLIKHKLSISGYNIIEAESSSSALVAISNHPDIDMIILDWNIEEVDDNSTFNILYENFSPIPILVIGNDTSNRAVISTLSMGAVDYIIKPIDHELLVFKVNNILSKEKLAANNKPAMRKQVMFSATSKIALISISKQSIVFKLNFKIPINTITTFTCEDLSEILEIPYKTGYSFRVTDCQLLSDIESNIPYYKIQADFLNLSPILASKIQSALSKNQFSNYGKKNKGYI